MTSVNRTDAHALLRLLDAALELNRASGVPTGLLVVYVEHFDRRVSAFGYRAGDHLIGIVAARLRETARPKDDVVKISDSKFVVIINPLRNEGIMTLAANKIARAVAEPIETANGRVTVELKIGMSATSDGAADAERLLQQAETALLTAVAEGRSCVRYAEAQAERNLDSIELELELEAAIEHKQFEVFYQTKICARRFEPCGAEALIRWRSPRRGFVAPELFIPLADREGRIEPLTAFVIHSALRQAAEWPRWRKLEVSVNVTPKLLLDPDFVESVAGALKLWDFEPGRLILEVTEGGVMTNPEHSVRALNALRDVGVAISIDDFGTGYSSLSHFKNIPADELKIDKSFVLDMLEDSGDRQIVRTIIELAKGFGLKVTAEGVEDEATAAALAGMRCDRLQGFYFSKPLPQAEFVGWLESYEPAPGALATR
jgi:diguanylate cyclase (GGDEF)-like protein